MFGKIVEITFGGNAIFVIFRNAEFGRPRTPYTLEVLLYYDAGIHNTYFII